MPVALTFQEPNTFAVRASGRVTFEECHAMHAELLADPNLCRGVRVLVDASASHAELSTSELRALAAEMEPMVQRGLGPVAVVTDSTCVYGVVRMFSVFAELVNADVMPFRERSDAERWLASKSAPRN